MTKFEPWLISTELLWLHYRLQFLSAETDIDQLSATSNSVKGKNMYSFQLFFLLSLYPYILKVLIVPTKGSYCPLRLFFLFWKILTSFLCFPTEIPKIFSYPLHKVMWLNNQMAYIFVKTSLGHSEFVAKYHGRFCCHCNTTYIWLKTWFALSMASVWYTLPWSLYNTSRNRHA